ncbi:MAG: hypothetical protein RDU14_12890 [Melioribacteraceae bacterium]|nr:hypothetical protein [Melioribacteraceae bacterium]
MLKKRLPLIGFALYSILILMAFQTISKREVVEQRQFAAPEARQGIAVDKKYLYVVDTKEIAKYDKQSFKLINKWSDENSPIIHLDSGVIIDGKLYCAHSNYPEIPMTSSIEIWDAKTLKHIDSHSFGINWGSCTWIDRHNGYWWAVFGHYNKWKEQSKTDVSWTTLVKFDDHWRMLESWVFPKEVLKKFEMMTNSGGSFGPDGLLYCTGHDAPELYVLKIPSLGSILELVDIVPINCTGQGIAWDRTDPGSIYTIRKAERIVVHSKMISK